MLEFVTAVCVLFGIPVVLLIADLFRGDRARALGSSPVFIIVALLGWWWVSIWVPVAVVTLSVLVAIGYYQDRPATKTRAQAKSTGMPISEYSGGHEIWRGPQKDNDQTEAEAIDARTRAARKRRMNEFSPEGGQVARGNYGVADYRRNADGEWKLSRQEWIASIDIPSIPDEGKWAKFEYADSDGVITNREIRHWSKRGAYIEGFCMLRREGRLFRQDRISDWVSG